MKRYRVLNFDFDTRVRTLVDPIKEEWEEKVKELHLQNRQKTEQSLIEAYGVLNKDMKKEDFIAIDSKPFSILAFHNRFFEQIRTSFIMGAYYPALTGACALGERILNHLMLNLRDDFKNSPEYKKIYRKKSFDDWDVPISILASWGILLPKVIEEFHQLEEIRNKSIHFRPETDHNDRALSLEAIHCLREIIENQFSAFGTQPWFITNIPGEIYLKKDWESNPFIKRVYLPNCRLVGYKHYIESLVPKMVVNDNFEYEDKEVSDDEFAETRIKYKYHKSMGGYNETK